MPGSGARLTDFLEALPIWLAEPCANQAPSPYVIIGPDARAGRAADGSGREAEEVEADPVLARTLMGEMA